MKKKGTNWPSWLLDAGRPLLMRVPQLLRAILLLLPPLRSLPSQPLLTIDRKGWWRPLPPKTRVPAQASSSRGRGGMTSWLHPTLLLMATLPPSGKTPQVPRPPSWCLKAGGRAPLGAITACLLLPICPPSSKRFSKPSKPGKLMAKMKIS